MSIAYLGQIALFGFPFVPAGFAPCQGQLLPLSQNVQLFSLIGANYGGNGVSTFALPNMPGVPVGAGQGPGLSAYALGDSGGEATVTLSQHQIPQHSHAFNALTDQAKSASPNGNELGRAWIARETTDNVANFYSPNPRNATTRLAPNAIAASGGGGPHNNLQPYLTLNYWIAMRGLYPPSGGTAAPAWTPFIGEIATFAFGFAPAGWLRCEGQLLPINQNQALFSLLGTAFGGDGRTKFALPDLRGRVPIGLGANVNIGQRGGEEAHALNVAELPPHSHALMADAATAAGIGNTPSAATVLGRSSGVVLPGNTPFSANLYGTGAPTTALNTQTIGNTGGGRPHQNMMPSLALNFCINVDPRGLYPSR